MPPTATLTDTVAAAAASPAGTAVDAKGIRSSTTPGSADAAKPPEVREATVIVVGAGPAGLGTAALLEKCGIDVVVLERGEVGQTFKAWCVCAYACTTFSSGTG